MTISGGEVVFKASWCRGLRALLNGDRHVTIKGMTMTFCLKVPRDQHLPLNRNSTSVFLWLCQQRGLSEDEATVALFNALTRQLKGVTGVLLNKCRYPQGGGPGRPDMFWDWWSPSIEVRIVFSTVELLRQALIDVSTAATEVWLYDAETREESVLAMRAWVVQGRGAVHADVEEEALFAGINANTRADNCHHMHVTGFNRATFLGCKKLYGAAAEDPEKLVLLFLEKLRTLDTLEEEALELVREEAMRAMSATGNHRPAKGRLIGGRGPTAWNLDGGMRLFPQSLDASNLYKLALVKGEDADGNSFVFLPNQPAGTLTITIKNPKGKFWQGKREKKVGEVDEGTFVMLTMKAIIAHINTTMKVCVRMTLPKPGQTLEEQPMQQKHAWPTLRNVLQAGVPDGMSWINFVDEYEARYVVAREDLYDRTGDQRLLKLFVAPEREDDSLEEGDEEDEEWEDAGEFARQEEVGEEEREQEAAEPPAAEGRGERTGGRV